VTLSPRYAAPLLQRVLDGMFAAENDLESRCIRGLIVVPTRELAEQTKAVLDNLLRQLERPETGGLYTSILDRFASRRETRILQQQWERQQRRAVGASAGFVALLTSGQKRHVQRNALKVRARARTMAR